MRIISQNGNVDLPYEKTLIFNATETVLARCEGYGKGIVLGEYSSMEKVCKAMEMLRNTYTTKEWKPSVVNKNGEVLEEMQFFDEKRYFQFPKDDEVEA